MSGFSGATSPGLTKSDVVNNLTNGSTNPVSSGGVYSALLVKTTFSLSLPSGWTLVNGTCFKIGKLVFISGGFRSETGVTSKSISFGNAIPSDYSCPYRSSFAAFNNTTDRPFHGIVNGRTIELYRPETESVTNIEATIIYVLN